MDAGGFVTPAYAGMTVDVAMVRPVILALRQYPHGGE